ncbi:hypothetical protein [Luteipulveratus halotolerans]|uniref:Glycosyltransferase RgtA/B/C/D-like domain-containing protein n=1 Tax=Luteipulveratus halotolerans TaxID=1631356 RepID=A0A0L6CMX4_9MICO|nr:hypothetical protein [Luteipulveratus halotolerans]KNX39067.1 hypothetical protein VV01_21165 [Luteipulveratus halotolerans]
MTAEDLRLPPIDPVGPADAWHRVRATAARRTQHVSTRARLALVVGATSVPLASWTARFVAGGWQPQGDEALISIRVGDVLSTDPPLMGMRSTSGITAPDVWAHHPGPIDFYAFAGPHFLAGRHPAGVLVGCLLLAVAMVAVAIWNAHRAAGWSGVAAVALVVLAMERMFGAGLVLPLNVWPPMLAFLATLVLAWRLVLGQVGAMPAYVVCASLAAQPHVAFGPPVGLLTAGLAVLGIYRWWARRDAIWPLRGYHRRPTRPAYRRPGWQAVAAAVVCSLPVLIETLTFDPPNVVELWRLGTTTQTIAVGAGPTWHVLAGSMVPVGRAHVGWDSLVVGGVRQGVAAVLLVVALAAVVQPWRRFVRRPARDGALRVGLAVALVSLVPIWRVGTGMAERSQLIYLCILAAAPLLVTSLTIAWVGLTAAHHLRQSPLVVGAPVGVLAAIALAVTPLTGFAHLMQDRYDGDVARADRIVTAVAAALDAPARRGRPVVVESYGLVPWASVGPALQERLLRDGRPVYFDTLWAHRQDEDQRRIEYAPDSALRVLLRELPPGGKWSHDAAPDPAYTRVFAEDTPQGRHLVEVAIT